MVILKKPQDRIGVGLYTPQEAARFAKLRTETFNRWFYGDKQGAPVLRPRVQPTDSERIVTFWDLIQAVAVRTLRTSPLAARLSLQHIRRVVDLCQEMGIQYPFARIHTLFLFGNRLIMRTDEGDYVGLEPGVDLGQGYHQRIIEPFLTELTFDSNKMASIWTPLQSPHHHISLDCNRRFGMPIVEPEGILVTALTDAVLAEGSIEAAAEAFETTPEAVRLALKYQEYLSSAA